MAVARVQSSAITPINLSENPFEATKLFGTVLRSASSPPPEVPEGKAPELTQYDEIEEYGPDTVRYKLKGSDQWVVIRKADNAVLFEHIDADRKALSAIRQSEREGYQLADGDEVAPNFMDYKDIGPAGELAPGTIRFEVRQSDGSIKKFVVAERVNPDLYEKVSGDSKILAEVHRLERNHFT